MPSVSVKDAVTLAKAAVGGIPQLCVTGEVSGFRGPNARSGHCYFQVKDDESSMDCIAWKGVYEKSGVELRDGLEIQMTGSFDVYVPSSRMNFIIRRMEASGEGALRAQVAALAKKLETEGLMDASRKRPVPRFCTRIAVVTSLSGSVLDDVKRTLARRNPLVEISVVGCAVQGAHAAPTIIRALEVAAAAQPECILLVRGGGSFEDLMCFNDEALARAVAACPVPVVTGIGHEPDTSICDMVADKRLSTPTAAAESVAPALDEIVAQMNDRRNRLARVMENSLSRERRELEAVLRRLPQALSARVAGMRSRLDAFSERRSLSEPDYMIAERRNSLELSAQRLDEAFPRTLARIGRENELLSRRFADTASRLTVPHRAQLERAQATLEALSPMRVLERGYAIVHDGRGHVVSDSSDVRTGEQITVRLAAGALDAQVTRVITDGSEDTDGTSASERTAE